MAMTKNDFQLVAECINASLKSTGDVLEALCTAFKTINPAFDRAKFLTACSDGVKFKKEKLEVGDRVVCISPSTGSCYSIGDLGTVIEVDESDAEAPYYIKWGRAGDSWVYTWEVEHTP